MHGVPQSGLTVPAVAGQLEVLGLAVRSAPCAMLLTAYFIGGDASCPLDIHRV